MRILIVDDEAGKLARICDVVRNELPDCELASARSFQSATNAIRNADFDLIILDMSLPTYDGSTAEAGGRPRKLGGEEIMYKITRRSISTSVVVLTQYTLFGDQGQFFSFEQIAERLRASHPTFHEMIHFSQSNNQWKVDLISILQQFKGSP